MISANFVDDDLVRAELVIAKVVFLCEAFQAKKVGDELGGAKISEATMTYNADVLSSARVMGGFIESIRKKIEVDREKEKSNAGPSYQG